MAATARIGTSGWSYPHWKGVFYPRELRLKDRFAYYSGAFDTVEVNNTFYRLPERAVFLGWRRAAPEGFIYALKASRYITHIRRLRDVRAPLGVLLARARLLGATLGPVLYQLPPNMARDSALLADFLALLPAGMRHVIEFRHPSWHDDATLAQLDAAGAGFCVHDRAECASPERVTGGFAYRRFHGAAGSGFGLYGPRRLAAAARWLAEELSAGRDAYAYFNNDGGGAAVADSLTLRRLLALDK